MRSTRHVGRMRTATFIWDAKEDVFSLGEKECDLVL